MAVAPRVSCCRRVEDATLARAVKEIDLAMMGSAQRTGSWRAEERKGERFQEGRKEGRKMEDSLRKRKKVGGQYV